MTSPAGDDFVGLDKQLCFAIYSAGIAFTAAYKPILEPHGLTYPQFLVLLALWEKDGVPLKDISDRLGLDPGSVTPLLKKLEGMGLLRRGRDPKNERQLFVELTDQGQALRPLVGEARCAFMRALDGEESILKARDEVARVTRLLQASLP
ncbi:MarR family transcriptional regulator [Methylobacterium sp. Leaf456]|uniref:MarR family winged helix-turn-helix transcriptional regulator n=1 Tax=Methylobacterium sp. Leaf456 TaxID=1736382 RepID=UPI0006F58111|nr:MarR family transcriptional regulator [Methylobacterium sp. Leaf456]KQT52097.1 MarR family transcriptional regulator [Methylobacterium sp. Leaf456]